MQKKRQLTRSWEQNIIFGVLYDCFIGNDLRGWSSEQHVLSVASIHGGVSDCIDEYEVVGKIEWRGLVKQAGTACATTPTR